MKLLTIPSRKLQIALATLVVLLVSALAAGMLFAANEQHQPDPNVSPAPAPERASAQQEDAQIQVDLPPINKEPPLYPNLDSNLNQLVEDSTVVQKRNSIDDNTTSEATDPVLVTFYVEPNHIDAMHEYLDSNDIFIRNAGEDYIEAHVPPALLPAASTQPGVLRVDTVIPPQPDSSVSPAPAPERASAQQEDAQIQVDLPPIDKEPPLYPNLDSNLNQLVEDSAVVQKRTSTDDNTTSEATDPVLVTFYVEPNHIDAMHEYLDSNDIFIRNAGEDYIEAHVPPALLPAASTQPGVLRVDTVIPPQPNQVRERVISQGVGLHGAEAWHNAGYQGGNVKVGVIDGGFEGFSQLQGNELPNNVTARCYFDGPQTPSSRLTDCEVEGAHGTAVAETVVDVAPDIELYISNPHSLGDLRNAVDWMVEQGVTVINVSLGYPYDGPGDGTSPSSNSPLKTIDVAASNGIVWVNSAGNNARTVWHGTFRDPNNTGIHHWTDQDVGNTFVLREGETMAVFMRWDDDWGQANCDLDLYMFDSRKGPDEKYPLVGRDITLQDGTPGSNPFASLVSKDEISASQAGVYFLVITKEETCTDDPAWVQLTAWIDGDLQYHSTGHHMGNPEESRNQGMLAVGATHYWNISTIAAYSSRGPTIDGRTKPDITGIACGRSTVYLPVADDGGQCWFRGTSQAAPHVAGMATLIQQRFPHYSPTETVRYLQRHASDRGMAGADNTWGHGLATLPSPEAVGPATSVTIGPFNEGGVVQVNWDAAPNATGYIIYAVNLDELDDANGQIVVRAANNGATDTYNLDTLNLGDTYDIYVIATAKGTAAWPASTDVKEVTAS